MRFLAFLAALLFIPVAGLATPVAGSATTAVGPATASRAGAPPPSPHTLCRAAIGTAEREAGLPAGLLGAIGRVESGRRDDATGEVGPWPWTTNAQGQGRYFPARAEALAHVRQLRDGGVRVIDVGCMQINLHFHPDAFPSLEDAFDPLSNARYAARFLKSLYERAGDWMRAAGHYHSHTPERAESYRNAVAAALPRAQREAGAAPGWNPNWNNAAATPRPAMPGPMPALARTAAIGGVPGGGMTATINRVPATEEASRGRGLDAYRAMAIPLAARMPAMFAGR